MNPVVVGTHHQKNNSDLGNTGVKTEQNSWSLGADGIGRKLEEHQAHCWSRMEVRVQSDALEETVAVHVLSSCLCRSTSGHALHIGGHLRAKRLAHS